MKMNHSQAQWNLLAALADENNGAEEMAETNGRFIQAIGNQNRMFPGWSRKLETSFKQWAATELSLLIAQQIDSGLLEGKQQSVCDNCERPIMIIADMGNDRQLCPDCYAYHEETK